MVREIKKPMFIRVPLDVADWINAHAARNASSQSSEIVRLIRDRIDAEREQAEQREVVR